MKISGSGGDGVFRSLKSSCPLGMIRGCPSCTARSFSKDDKLYLKDMGSRNGTYLNGKRVTQPVLIQRDDVIGMGETEIEVQSMMREK